MWPVSIRSISGLWMVWRKNAIIHVCLEHIKHMEVCKESIRDLLKDCGFQNITIEVDADVASHQVHKRNMVELEASHDHDHHH